MFADKATNVLKRLTFVHFDRPTSLRGRHNRHHVDVIERVPADSRKTQCRSLSATQTLACLLLSRHDDTCRIATVDRFFLAVRRLWMFRPNVPPVTGSPQSLPATTAVPQSVRFRCAPRAMPSVSDMPILRSRRDLC
jgi:hypothetical protein